MVNSQFNANISSMKGFILSSLIEEQGVAKTSVSNDKAKEIYNRLNPILQDIFKKNEVQFHRMTSEDRRELCAAFMEKDYSKVSQIVEKSLLQKGSPETLRRSFESAQEELKTASFVVDDKGDSGRATNPVLFYSEEGKLSTYFPGKLVGVMKGRLSKGVDYNRAASKIYKEFISLGYGVGNPPPKSVVSELLHRSFPDVYSGFITGEAEAFENQVMDSFKTHLSETLESALPSVKNRSEMTQKLFKLLQKQGYSDAKSISKEAMQAILRESFPDLHEADAKQDGKLSEVLANAVNADLKEGMKGYELWTISSGGTPEETLKEKHQRRSSAEMKSTVIQELKARGTVPRGLEEVRDRYINTALFAKELDDISGTNLTPRLTNQEVTIAVNVDDKVKMRENIRGIFQEKMDFIPLGITGAALASKYGLDTKKDVPQFTQRTFDLIGPYIDSESYQRAIIRETELADADLHSGNVALIPKMGDQDIPSITRLNPIQMQSFLEGLNEVKKNKGASSELVQGLREKLVEGAMKKTGTDEADAKQNVESFLRSLVGEKKDQSINDRDIAEKLNELAGLKGTPGLRFDVKLFDVDLTMPQSNTVGVTAGKPPVRNILLAFPQANDPLSPTVRGELLGLRNKRQQLRDAATRKFDDETVSAFMDRIDLITGAADKPVMTPRGIVWSVFPDYAEAEVAYDAMQEVDEAPNIPSEKYDFIGFGTRCNTLASELRGYGLKIEVPKSFPVNI